MAEPVLPVGDMVAARPEFIHFSEADVWTAMEKDDRGPIAAEVMRLMTEYMMGVKARECQNPSEPGVLVVRPRSAIERIAIQILVKQGPGFSLVTIN